MHAQVNRALITLVSKTIPNPEHRQKVSGGNSPRRHDQSGALRLRHCVSSHTRLSDFIRQRDTGFLAYNVRQSADYLFFVRPYRNALLKTAKIGPTTQSSSSVIHHAATARNTDIFRTTAYPPKGNVLPNKSLLWGGSCVYGTSDLYAHKATS